MHTYLENLQNYLKSCSPIGFFLVYQAKHKKYTQMHLSLIFLTSLLTFVYLQLICIFIQLRELFYCNSLYTEVMKFKSIFCIKYLIFVNIKKPTYTLSKPLAAVCSLFFKVKFPISCWIIYATLRRFTWSHYHLKQVFVLWA